VTYVPECAVSRALRPRRLRTAKTAGSVGVGAENLRD
jgi:hypothetical protein